MESKGVFTSRLQNLAITVDKVKHFLKKQKPEMAQTNPIYIWNDEEILDFLWFSRNSIVRRIVETGLPA